LHRFQPRLIIPNFLDIVCAIWWWLYSLAIAFV
jgi:hypothetical protein